MSKPHSVQNVYFSIIPDHDYVIKYRDSYEPTDKETVSNCKEISEYKICSRNQPSIKLLDSETCEATLFKRYVNNKCKKSPFFSTEKCLYQYKRLRRYPFEEIRPRFSLRKLLELIKNCIPTRICLFCNKTKIDTPTHVITYNANLY